MSPHSLERREFLKVLGVTGAGAAATACGGAGAAEKLIPYVVPHEEIVPGVATWYRTTCLECPAGCGMEIRTREGRAVKAEGNPLSPISHGRLCARGHASLHGLYNPDRVPQALARREGGWDRLTWDDAEQRLADALAANRGRAVFLTETTTGSLDRLFDEFCAAFEIERVRWEPFALEPIRAANRLVFGVDAVPVHDFANADVVITFGADFLETWLSPVDYAHGFVQAHAFAGDRRGRLISVTPHQSLTDMNADEWLPVRPGTEHLVALAIARSIVDGGAPAGAAQDLLLTVDIERNAAAAEVSPERLRQIARAFANSGRSLAVGPGIASMHGGATAVAAAVAVLNAVAGNIGRTVRLDGRERAGAHAGSYAGLKAVLARMQDGEIGALLVHGPNPVYALPDSDQPAQAIGRVGFVASFSPYLDETGELAHLLLPDHHFLEAWGDAEPRTGVHALVQPVMTPVFATKQTGDVLLSVARRAGARTASAAATFYDYLRERWSREIHPAAGAAQPFDEWWRQSLETGLALAPVPASTPPAIDPAGLASVAFAEPEFTGDATNPLLIVYPSYRFYDGRLANRPWLQELPDPVSKFCWSSWIELNAGLADEMGLDTGHVLEVATPAGTVTLPVWRHPGMRRDVVAIQLGQGHTSLGAYAVNRGANGIKLLGAVAESASGAFVWQQARASIRATGSWQRPIQAGLQDEQHDREIARSFTFDEAREAERARRVAVLGGAGAVVPEQHAEGEQAAAGHDQAAHPSEARVQQLQGSAGLRPLEVDASPTGFPPPETHYGEYSEERPRWGMAIDLEHCIGCSACITACYAENNIGIVGPEQVKKGRIMHWIRIERYFEGQSDSLHTRFLPMVCQQCGNAPCEPVCPVFASYHTPDGLNAQVYNRCVGTRYCANNCPYKVRVYNWFSWEWPEPLNWQLNPDVTVREKGVMEKCTFCVQRIREAENRARLEDRAVRDGEITPACAQTCPGDAIVFGNLRDPGSRVARLAASGRGYRVFEELNTQSAVVYLRRVVTGAAEAQPG